ncbi:Subtilisin-like protease [Dorcoceras hygrometricum]|uniref:Subtilisin-like protease n=1 Tax=Dorcoceras hygrometricum TaxID=472368 RepID=A0A2Z7ASQ9_9LAMI|nr:Subtilisin-like protease [Dorcoceras hygrometricum]
MASSLINNAIQVYFDFVLGMEHEGMVAMFEALLLLGLSVFLGCSSAIYKATLVEFFHNASVRDGKVVSTVQRKLVSISDELFAGTFELPLEGLTDLHEVPQDLVFEARNAFSYDGKLLSTSSKKREMTFEFGLLNDILAKSVTVKAGLFDAVTHGRFLMMSAIHGGIQPPSSRPSLHSSSAAALRRRTAPPVAACRDRTCSDHLDEEIPSVVNSSALLVQTNEGVLFPVVDRIRRSIAANL